MNDVREAPGVTTALQFGVLCIDPATNPAVLASGTWNPAAAVAAIAGSPAEALDELAGTVSEGRLPRVFDGLTPYAGSMARRHGSSFTLAGLPDGQYVLLEFRPAGQAPLLSGRLCDLSMSGDVALAVHSTDAPVLHRYLRDVVPAKSPRALGPLPRLGIGVRMTTACWPAIFEAMEARGFAANAIQNSVRELNFLADLLEGRPADRNYASGFGMIEAGYTGSSFEGLWTWGALEALKHPGPLTFGADADHLQVKRGQDGMARVRRCLDSCRYHSFFTMDMADILDYASLQEPSSAVAADRARSVIGSDRVHRQVTAHHRGPRPGGRRLDEAVVDRLIGKYWRAFEALTEVEAYLREIKQGEAYDLEFTIDEHPPEIAAFDCLTSDEECFFVVNELARRELPVTHLAPNTGTEKGFDYRGADGLAGFERRVASLARITADRGILIDIHSADDLTAPARAAIRRATGGKLHYKVSPMLQLLFAGVLEDVHPDLFTEWWNDAVAYAREERGDSPFAAWCLDELALKGSVAPSRHDPVFHHYGFRFVGRRDGRGQFLNRARFYSLSPEFYRLHEERIAAYVGGLADELLA